MNLRLYLEEAIYRLRAAPDAERLDLFLTLRYPLLSKAFPHDVFSVGQATLSFFDIALSHLAGAPFDEPTKDGGAPPEPSVYEANYRRWIRSHR